MSLAACSFAAAPLQAQAAPVQAPSEPAPAPEALPSEPVEAEPAPAPESSDAAVPEAAPDTADAAVPEPSTPAPEASPVAEPEPEPAPASDEILVTAQFRKQNPQKTPLAITAISGRMLEERSQINIADVANQAPNVRLSPGSGAFGPSLQAHIRGVGQFDFNYAFEPGVGMYVDDVYFSTLTGSLLDLLDLERIEILRGPQGTLAGQNSIGGAIKLYSKTPKGDNTGFVQTTYGRFNRTELRSAGDFTLIKDRLFGRIAGVANHSDGYVTRYDYACTHPGTGAPTFQDSEKCQLGTEGGKAYAATRATLRWMPTDQIDVNLSGDYTNDNSQAAPNTLLYVGTPAGQGVPNDPMTMMPAPNTAIGGVPLGGAMGSQFISYSPFAGAAADPASRNAYRNYSTYTDASPTDGTSPYSVQPVYRVNSGGAAAKAVFDLSDNFSLTSISAYRAYQGDWSVDEGSPVNVFLLHNVVSHRQFTQELRLNGKLLHDAIDFTLGGFYLTQRSHYGGRISLRTARLVEDDAIPAMTAAGFGNVEWRIIPAFSLIGGMRVTRQEKTFEYGRAQVAGVQLSPLLAALNDIDGKFAGTREDYRAALQYQWVPELMTYVQFATGFKGGGVNPRPFVPDQALSHKPETLNAFELGVKSDLFQKRLRINVAAFFNQYKDIVMTGTMCPASVLPAPCFLPLNAGNANVMGGELETLITPVDHASIDASLSYLKFKYDSLSPEGASSGITRDMTGPYVPAWEASVGARYEFVLGSAGILAPRLDFSYRDSFFTSPNNSPFSKVDGRALLNGRLVWISNDDLWQIAVSVTNITNLLYYYSIRDDRGSTFTVQGQPAPPREWAISVKRNFL